MTQYFHFTLGPVQSFVSQARRTRDFWAGSFILSWLSAVAMNAVEKQEGTILFPKPDQKFMEALEQGGMGPTQGNVPNRFKAEVGVDFSAEAVTDSVQLAWQTLARKIWKGDLEGVGGLDTQATRTVWDRQIPAFWDIQWALVDDPKTTDTLDRMKNWRTHLAPDEGGIKCMVMDGWQELSGAARPGRHEGDPEGPDVFWAKLRGQKKSGIDTDLRDKEMLCAVAYVKRRFTRYFKDIVVSMPGGWVLRGWKLPDGVPSVHYMAAAHWLARLISQANANDIIYKKLWAFHDAAKKMTGGYGEWDSNIRCVKNACEVRLQNQWAALDGTVFFETMLENKHLWQDKTDDANSLLNKLKELRGAADLGPTSPFYAVLLMDGDELGIHMGDPKKQAAITNGLASFTGKVQDIIEHNNGFLIYAGGDDVLTLLPIEDALACAAELREHYLSCFDAKTLPTTLSGAIEYAHIKMPLGKVLHDTHELLDNVAKNGCGRDAIACRVWKPGGQAIEWAMPWQKALNEKGQVILERLASELQQVEQLEGGGEFASKLFYRIKERFDLLNPASDQHLPIIPPDQAITLMAMEYLNSGNAQVRTMAQAREKIEPLLEQCRRQYRKREGTQVDFSLAPSLKADGALLVHFLARKGVER